MYAGDNKGQFPRTFYPPTGSNSGVEAFSMTRQADPFQYQSNANDVTAPLYLLIKEHYLTAEVFICPSSTQVKDDINAPGGAHRPLELRSNFDDTDFAGQTLSYGYASPYENRSLNNLAKRRYKLTLSAPSGLAVAADRNDGINRYQSKYPGASKTEMILMNSRNHGGRGQNVLFLDGHVVFYDNPFVGIGRDNIYTRKELPGEEGWMISSPADGTDSFILPRFPLHSHFDSG
jgi:prepilin-type processing-associated H-X9-DG protein